MASPSVTEIPLPPCSWHDDASSRQSPWSKCQCRRFFPGAASPSPRIGWNCRNQRPEPEVKVISSEMQWGGYFRIPVEVLVEHVLQSFIIVVPLEVVVAALLVSASSFATRGGTCRPSTGCPRTLSSPSAAKTGTAPSWRNLNKHNATTLNGNLLGSRSHGLGSSLGPSL